MNLASRFAALLVASLFFTTAARAAGPTIDIVVGEKADPLEKFAAEELAGQLKKLYDAEVRIGSAAAKDAADVILLGTTQSNPLLASAKIEVPADSQESFALQTLQLQDKPVLAVVGSNPRRVLWAVYELGRRHGVRYFLFGDLYPTAPPPFTTSGFEVRDATTDHMSWTPNLRSPIDGAWGKEDFKKLLLQLTKLRFVEFKLPKLDSRSPLGVGLPILVAGDTIGRAAFRGEKYFDNPDFKSETSPDARRAGYDRIVRELATEAKRLGWDVTEAAFEETDSGYDVLPEPHPVEFYFPLKLEGGALVGATPKRFDDILTPVCGDGLFVNVKKAFDLNEAATGIRIQNAPDFDDIGEKMLLDHYDSDEPPPAWWGGVRKNYLDAMSEMYRANTRAREGGRAFTLYYARRFEFGFEYMNAVEAVRKAGIAKRKGDKNAQIEELEKAIDSVTNCCNAMAAVARSPSDRGVIAVMNEYGYRPLLKLLEEAETE